MQQLPVWENVVGLEKVLGAVKVIKDQFQYRSQSLLNLARGYFSCNILHEVCTISFERPVNYLCDAWHVFPPKYEAWTHFNRPWTEYQCQGVVWTLLIIFTESVNRSTCLSVYLIITRLRNVNLLCFSDSIEGIDFLNCTLKCPVTLKLANQNRYFYWL